MKESVLLHLALLTAIALALPPLPAPAVSAGAGLQVQVVAATPPHPRRARPPARRMPIAASAPAVGITAATAAAPISAPAPSGPSPVAKPEFRPAPDYPAYARKRGWQGEVRVLLQLDAEGQVARAELKQSSGFELLDQAALTAVQGWKLALRDRQLEVPVIFRLR